jgi:formylglycine-generating enzyme required for sulfatase activity
MFSTAQQPVGRAALVLLALGVLWRQDLPAATPSTAAPADMALVAAGVYRPAFRAATEPKEVPVRAFYLDKLPVTTGEYLEFVRANPRWRCSQVKPIFADRFYLKDWAGDLEPGANAPLDTPVTCVSWFAAKAFAQWKGRRLPTVAEWEYAAGASANRPDGENDLAFRQEILRWYTTSGAPAGHVGAGRPNYWGIYDLHGLMWEWVLDFNAAMVTGDSRADAGGLERGLFCGAGAQGARAVDDYPAFMRLGFRSSLSANFCVHNLGFRCAKDL